MSEVCSNSQTYLDPFCGSGTVLYEALARGRNAIGFEVNPAAWHLAALANLQSLGAAHIATLIKAIRNITEPYSRGGDDLFAKTKDANDILECIKRETADPHLQMALAATVLLGVGNGSELTHEAVSRGSFQVLSVLREISQRKDNAQCKCRLSDARYTEIEENYIDAIITSPPYINVFNYHQNYRAAAEMLGWNVLEAARAEIGSNRKHRMNRFLTVTQYCLDMGLFIEKMSSVLRRNGVFIIILGRTSNVLGCSFRNGEIIHSLMKASNAFDNVTVHERVFTNRFGERIFEDIIVANKIAVGKIEDAVARMVGKTSLEGALPAVSEANRNTLISAIEQVPIVKPSSPLAVSVPRQFENVTGII